MARPSVEGSCLWAEISEGSEAATDPEGANDRVEAKCDERKKRRKMVQRNPK